MRSVLLLTPLAAVAAARVLSAREGEGATAPNDLSLAVPKFHAVSEEEAVSSLSAMASATPSAVKLLPGVPLSIDSLGVIHNVVPTGLAVTDSAVETPVPVPNQKRSKRQSSCTNPAVWKEWSSLSDTDKQGFTAAIKCLFGKPARSGLPGVQNRWDDLAAVHQVLNPNIHGVGQFLPWHRYFLYMFEQELRNTCGYKGSMTWWDEQKNAGNFAAAAPFTDQYFGHMPDGKVVCITSGQFANTNLHIGPGSDETSHCLSRGVNEQTSKNVASSYVNTCNSYTNYNDMQSCSDFGPHGNGHNAVGGVMGDVQSSPGDPSFFLHHLFINRNWRVWQRADPNARTYAIGGSTTQNCGNNCQPTTLNYVLSSKGFYPNVTVQQVMDTQGGFLCYHYDY